jgi:alkanesulfonate monooxygenase SsuD/methylene tetrahydromethanopterin reductase-like flavin-dependent oxidoreductase (luciferase family)
VESTDQPTQEPDVFTWHPKYKGQEVERVRRDLRDEIGRDQRQYALSLEGAEQAEHDSLSTVVELERRWGSYDFDWAETDPQELADRIIQFELERDSRQELISFSDYRAELDDSGEEVTPELAWKTKPVLITAALGALVVIIILLAVL